MNIPIELQSDVNVAALGEATYGVGRLDNDWRWVINQTHLLPKIKQYIISKLDNLHILFSAKQPRTNDYCTSFRRKLRLSRSTIYITNKKGFWSIDQNPNKIRKEASDVQMLLFLSDKTKEVEGCTLMNVQTSLRRYTSISNLLYSTS